MERLEIKHYEMPVSVNAMNFVRWGRKINSHATNSFYHHASEEVMQILNQSNQKELLIFLSSLENKQLELKMVMTKKWLTKHGKMRKNDVENYAKSEIDLLFKCLNTYLKDKDCDITLDDSQLYHITLIKKEEGKLECVYVELEEYKEVGSIREILICPL